MVKKNLKSDKKFKKYFSVSSQTLNCIVCDSKTESNCGHNQASAQGLRNCESQIGCFSRIYYGKKSQKSENKN